MAYRDDREALHHRVAQLEQELHDARREGEEHGRDEAQARAVMLEQRLAGMKVELETMGAELHAIRGRKPRSAAPVALIATGSALLLMGVAFFMALRTKSTHQAPRIELMQPPSPVIATQAATPTTTSTPPGTAAMPSPSARSTKARWNANVARAEGLAIAPGSTCTIDATISATDTNAIVRDLAIQCGMHKLYRSTDGLNGMAQMSNDAREKLERGDDKSTFTLAFSDIGTRTGERSQVDLDTTRRQASVYRETIPRFRVELSMPSASVPGVPLSGLGERLRRTGKVTEVSGAAPVKGGATCVLRAMATGKAKECTAEIACGATIVWPSSAPVRCTYEASRPASVAADEGPTALSLDGPTLTVKTKTFGAVITLDEP